MRRHREMAKRFGEMIRQLRHEKSMSQRELATQVGVHHTYVSKLEAEQEQPSRDVVRRLAGALGADTAQFELAASYVPEGFAEVIAQRPELHQVLALAAQGKLSEEGYQELRQLVKREGMAVLPVWLK